MGIMGASWMPTVFGILASIFGSIAALPEGTVPPWVKFAAAFLFAGSTGAVGVTAKQWNISNAPKPAIAGQVVIAPDAPVPPVVPVRTITP